MIQINELTPQAYVEAKKNQQIINSNIWEYTFRNEFNPENRELKIIQVFIGPNKNMKSAENLYYASAPVIAMPRGA